VNPDAPEFRSGTLEALKSATRVVALTGSGISAESGIPTFRGEDGLWKGYRAEELATPEGFSRNPERVWEWYRWRLDDFFRKAKPNPGHLALARLEEFVDLTVVTQNIDGLHQRAGNSRILELHGSAWRVKCSRQQCDLGHGKTPDSLEKMPVCECGAPLRPDVVWFGEMLPPGVLEDGAASASACDVALVVGTSALVYPAASLPFLALEAGAFVIEVNPAPTPLSSQVQECLCGQAGKILPALIDAAFV